MSDERRLTPADAVWLYSEWEGNHQTVSSLMWLDREIDPADYRELIQTRMVDKYPTFHQRIRKSRNPLFMPYWEDDPEFSLDNHIEVIQLPAPGDKAALQALVSEQRSLLLDQDRPLWKVYLIQGYEGRTAVHTRIQHSIGDGWALVRLVLSLADEAAEGSEAPKVVDKQSRRKRESAIKAAQPAVDAVDAVVETVKQVAGKVGETATTAAGAVVGAAKNPKSVPGALASGKEALEETLTIDVDFGKFAEFGASVPETLAGQLGEAKDSVLERAIGVGGTAGVVQQGGKDAIDFVVTPRPGKTILHGKVSGTKKVAWMEPIPLEPIRAAGKTMGATINDVLMGCQTNALRQYLLEKDSLDVDELMTAVPVSLRKATDPLPRTLGNRFGLVNVLLPVGIADQKEQVLAIKNQIDEIKASQMPIVSFGLTSISSVLTPDVERMLHKVVQDQSLGVTTNVPGPRGQLRLAGGVVEGCWGMGGMSGNMNMSTAIFTLDGKLNFAVSTDTAITADPERVVELFEASVQSLLEQTGVAS